MISHPRKGDRVSIIDIGSRSLQLVIYADFGRSLLPIHREKVITNLGQNLNNSGILFPEGRKLTESNVGRFVSLVREMKVEYLALLGTAAMREAQDGLALVKSLEILCETSVRILSGPEEALYSAYGVISAFPEAHGLMGDLGGGSLELVHIDKAEPKEKTSFPLGPLALINQKDIHEVIQSALNSLSWIAPNQPLYLVGGAWRTLANYHMEKMKYPIPISLGYRLNPEEALKLCRKIMKASPSQLEKWSRTTAERKQTLPLASLVLHELIEYILPSEIIFSSYGLREGYLYSLISPKERKQDPLIEGCVHFNNRNSRCPDFAQVAYSWMNILFPEKNQKLSRLRLASCLLSDMCWMDHHNFDDRIGFFRALSVPYVGISHSDRSFLAYAIFTRYGGKQMSKSEEEAVALLDKEGQKQAWLVGLLLNLAYILSGGTTEILKQTKLSLKNDTLGLSLPDTFEDFEGFEVNKRLKRVGKILGLKTEIYTS